MPLFAALSNAETYRYMPSDPPKAAEELEARYRRTSAGPRSPDERWYNWAVSVRELPGQPFGTVELTLRERGTSASLGYVFGKGSWGRGYAFEACSAVLEFLRTQMPVRTVKALIDTRNARSIALIERLGFTRVATLERADFFKGSSSDEYEYRLTFDAEQQATREAGSP